MSSAGRPQNHGEPTFLGKGKASNIRILVGDFVSFTLVGVFYLLCWLICSPAYMVDNMFGTRLVDRFTRLMEYLDDRHRD